MKTDIGCVRGETGNFPSEISVKGVLFCDPNKYIFVSLPSKWRGEILAGECSSPVLDVRSSTKEVKRCIEN